MKEKIWIKIAWLLPRRLVYWCYIRMQTFASTTKLVDKSPGEITCLEAMDCWENSK